ncbi:MAG: HEAT repeat domain-containing protein, partial [Chitinispirillia bacterium]
MLDSNLAVLNADRGDLYLPWDAVKDDIHRLDNVKKCFNNPLYSFDITDTLVTGINDSIFLFFEKIVSIITKKRFEHKQKKILLSEDEISGLLTKTFDMPVDSSLMKILGQYLTASLGVAKKTELYRKTIKNDLFNNIVEYADSMLLHSEESESLSVYQLKEAEERALVIAKKFFNDAGLIHLQDIFGLGINYYKLISVLNNENYKKFTDTGNDNGMSLYEWETPYGKVAYGGTGDNIYKGNYLLIIDIGGNDTYICPENTKNMALQNMGTCIVDFSGNDTYSGYDYSFGSGFFSISIVIDTRGNDRYIAGNFSLGSGLFGIGIVEDLKGNDIYSGGICTQGSGAFGIGLLLDREGNDVYNCQTQAQGFGYTRGFGGLVDWNGNDSYVTSSPFQDFLRYDKHFIAFTQGAGLGYRPVASGGIGMLCDYKGNDTYTSDIFCQGTSYWYSLGILYDSEGDDQYQSHQYAQGSGIHLTHAILWDKSGNDKYRTHGVSQGCGHDIAFGALIDEQGDDEYTAFGLSMGGGNADAISLFMDVKGDDSYIAKTPSTMMGYSDFRRDYSMIGLFADGGGQDLYSDTLKNNSSHIKSTHGAFIDLSLYEKTVENRDIPELTPPDSLKIPLASTIDSLFIQASAAPQKFQYNVKPARDSIIAMGTENHVLLFLGDKLDSESARERHALRNLLERFYEIDTAGITNLITDSLLSNNSAVVAMAADICGRKKIESGLTLLNRLLADSIWNIRQLAARNIGKIGNVHYTDSIRKLLDDPHAYVRMRA